MEMNNQRRDSVPEHQTWQYGRQSIQSPFDEFSNQTPYPEHSGTFPLDSANEFGQVRG